MARMTTTATTGPSYFVEGTAVHHRLANGTTERVGRLATKVIAGRGFSIAEAVDAIHEVATALDRAGERRAYTDEAAALRTLAATDVIIWNKGQAPVEVEG